MASIAFKAVRQGTIYHMASGAGQSLGGNIKRMRQAGLDLVEVPYEEFKRCCLQRGLDSPLASHWGLLDWFKGYWVCPDAIQRDPACIDQTSVVADLGCQIPWPKESVVSYRAQLWMMTAPDSWPLPRPVVSLEVDHVITTA
ncbi:unnamed protein product, partial [Chrysoparadoxa australica]